MSGAAFDGGEASAGHAPAASAGRVWSSSDHRQDPGPREAVWSGRSSPVRQRLSSAPLVSSPLAQDPGRPAPGSPSGPSTTPPFPPVDRPARTDGAACFPAVPGGAGGAGGGSPFDAPDRPGGSFRLFQNSGGFGDAARRAATSNARQNHRAAPGYPPDAWKDRFKRRCAERLKEARQAKFDGGRAALDLPAPLAAAKGKLAGDRRPARRRLNSGGGSPGDIWEEKLVRLEWQKFCAENEMSCVRECGNVLTPEMASELEEELLYEMRQARSAATSQACSSIDDEYDRYLAEEEDAVMAAISTRADELAACVAAAEEFVLAVPCFGCGAAAGSWSPIAGADAAFSLPERDGLTGCRSCDARLDRGGCHRLGSLLIAHRTACPGFPSLFYHPATGLLLMCSSCEASEAVA